MHAFSSLRACFAVQLNTKMRFTFDFLFIQFRRDVMKRLAMREWDSHRKSSARANVSFLFLLSWKNLNNGLSVSKAEWGERWKACGVLQLPQEAETVKLKTMNEFLTFLIQSHATAKSQDIYAFIEQLATPCNLQKMLINQNILSWKWA